VCATCARRAGAPGVRLGTADHNGGSRRDESPGALSSCAKRRRAPHRVGPRPRSPARRLTRTTYGRRVRAARLVRATSDSRDSRSGNARAPRRRSARPEQGRRAQRDCRAGLGTQRGSQRTMRRAQLFHATSAGARTRCAARMRGAATPATSSNAAHELEQLLRRRVSELRVVDVQVEFRYRCPFQPLTNRVVQRFARHGIIEGLPVPVDRRHATRW
jgi:hypothetical protein